MEFDETQVSLEPEETKPEPKPAPVDPDATLDGREPSMLGERFDGIADGAEAMGFETRRQQGMVAAALFDEDPIPVKIDRFTIVRELGAGGMGVVYMAYDEKLDRRVAVKLLRGASPSSDAQFRLEREAVAMARLSHPNVVGVHEVGTHEGQVFVAMEFVDGPDLRGWMESPAREDWRAVVAMFAQAGEGLAAAHDVGLVHRDFKPDNVLVGNDGRARVADFGLAHAFDSPPEREAPVIEPQDSQGNLLETPLTRTGALMGTPAYMAPEQYADARSDARGDQFSFCVALWEALYRKRPFSGQNLYALSDAITSGRIDEPPEDSEVPPWLRAVVGRGLASEPDARWPSMRALIDALTDDPQARRRRWVAWIGVTSVTGALIAGLSWLAVTQLRDNARQGYWSDLTEQLLDIERARGLRQANDDATRARDATRMSVLRSYKPGGQQREHEDPTTAAVLLREVEGEARQSSEWLSTANELLGDSLSFQVLRGHRDTISALVFDDEGEWVYSGSVDGEVWRWHVRSGEGEQISSHEALVQELALSPDGTSLASCSRDGAVELWSKATGASRPLPGHEQAAMTVDFDPSGRWLASGAKDGTIEVHALDTGESRALEGGGGPIYSVRFDAEGRLLTGSDDGVIRRWDVAKGRLLGSLVGHSQAVFHLHPQADGTVVSGSDDKTVRVWSTQGQGRVVVEHAQAVTAVDVEAGNIVSAALDGSVIVSSVEASQGPRVVRESGEAVWSVAFTPGGEAFVTASFDGTAQLSRTDGTGVPRIFVGHRLALLRVAVDPSGRWLGTGSYDSELRLWDLGREPLSVTLQGHANTVFRVAADAKGERLVTASHDGSARVWDSRDGTSLAVLRGGTDKVNHAIFNPEASQVAVARTSGEVELWSLETGERRVLEGHTKSVWELSFDSRGRKLASASFDETVRIWDVDSGVTLHTLDGHGDRVVGVSMERDGSRVATAAAALVRIWDVDSGELAETLDGHSGRIVVLVRGPDGETLASGADDGTVRVWSPGSSDAIVLPGHEKEVWAVAFDASGERIATGCHDRKIRIWSADTGELQRTLTGHADVVWAVSFLPDEHLLSASADGTVRVWSLAETGGEAVVLTGHRGGIIDAQALVTGDRFVSVGSGGEVRLWSLERVLRDNEVALTELWQSTRDCLPMELRVRELGEDRDEALARLESCRAGVGQANQ